MKQFQYVLKRLLVDSVAVCMYVKHILLFAALFVC
jgi:hypothetical protein